MAAPANRRVILNPDNELNNIPIKRGILNPENEVEEIDEFELSFDELQERARNIGISDDDIAAASWLNKNDSKLFDKAIIESNIATIKRLVKLAKKLRKTDLLTTIRTQKPKPAAPFEPSSAYGIFGHGEEHPYETFIVPPNCIVIAKAAPGERTYYTKIREYLNRLYTYGRHDIYAKPLKYMSEIINDFGSVRVYKPGDRCPSFTYYLRPSAKELGLENGVLTSDRQAILQLNHYGVFSLPSLTYKEDRITTHSIYGSERTDAIMNSLYWKSKHPTLEDCQNWLGDTYTKSWRETIQIMHDRYIDEMSPPNYIFPAESIATQYELFGYDPASGEPPKRPGVYYNFICRNRYNSENTYIYNNTRGKENIRTNLPMFFTAPAGIKKILGNRILEAETARKHLIPGTKFNQPARTRRNSGVRFRKTRRRK